jgi:hypothetical protein
MVRKIEMTREMKIQRQMERVVTEIAERIETDMNVQKNER